MLPLRISVQGFMSYRDYTTFDFEGARLWMLSGANGAGKSTVFDALRWVLFGVHRAGKQKPEQLIHHEAAKLLVEVELRLGEEIYKLKRTLGREGARPTWDVARRVGGAWESVAGTSMSSEYNRWIESHIGLTDEAFCASVYLSQGRADAILNADAEARYELLAQLVDLEAYERWHERADARRGGARAQMTEARRRWEMAPSPAPEVIDELRERGTALESAMGEASARVRELDGARAESSRWEEWSARLEALEAEGAGVRAVLGDEEAIERDFRRLEYLRRHRGVVDGLWDAWNRHLALEKQITELKPQLEQSQRELDAVQERNRRAQVVVEVTQSAAMEANVAWSAQVGAVAELAPQRAAIEQRGRSLAQRGEQARRLATFEEDGEARFEAATSGRDRAREAARVFPLWQRFVAAQRGFVTAQEQQGEWSMRHERALSRQSELQLEVEEARSALETATRELGRAKEEMAKVEERERALNLRRADFARVEGDSRCHFCGQELSPEHRAAEVERLEQTAEMIEKEKANADLVLRAAQEGFESARRTAEEREKALNALSSELAEAAREVRHQSDNAVREHSAARGAWDEVGELARARWGAEGGGLEMRDLSGVTRPHATDLEGMKSEARNVTKLEKEVARWQKRVQERRVVVTELVRLDGELKPLLGQWSDGQVEEWHRRAGQMESELESAQHLREVKQSEFEKARIEASEAAQQERAAQGQVNELVRQLGPLEGQEIAAREALQDGQTAFDKALERGDEVMPSWEAVRVLREKWTGEMNELEGANIGARYGALVEARGKLADLERDRMFYGQQIESLSLLARRPRVRVEAEWNEAKTRQGQMVAEREEVGDLLRRLEREIREQKALEVQLQEKTLEHERWEEMARLLGPHQLQRYLLREAEGAIVREANGILEAISGGTLRLELVPDSDEESGNRRPKVLDVVCFPLNGSEDPQAILPAFLSGSQRFRVAVALALGIGRTAARGSGNGQTARVETILIDEGFGSLDKTGRDEMKDELRELGRELGRVILVSHQEDFANAFPNRFNISLENGVSRVQKVVE